MRSAESSPDEVWAIIAAGGSGRRFCADGERNKLFAPLRGRPVLEWTLRALLAATRIDGVAIAIAPTWREAALATVDAALVGYGSHDKPILCVSGGPTRRASTFNALQALAPEVSIAVIHDAARPLIRPACVDAAVAALQADPQAQGVVVALPARDTIKRAHGQTIAQTVDRNVLWSAQTPQVFRRQALQRAHQQTPLEMDATDDAQLLEFAGIGPVRLTPGEARNLKITDETDLALAEAWLALDAAPLASSGGGGRF